MSGETSVSAAKKLCCACGQDVATQARMKDSQGKYWCVPCGEADQKKKSLTSTHSNCAGCHKSFAKGQLDRLGEHVYCKACLKKRMSSLGKSAAPVAQPAQPAMAARLAGGGAVMTGGHPERKRMMLMAALGGLLLAMSLLLNFVFAK